MGSEEEIIAAHARGAVRPAVCAGREPDRHAAGCSKETPLCRWNRPRCTCPAYHYPHRPGSGFCGNSDRQNATLYGVRTVKPLPIGSGMTENAWWLARHATVLVLRLDEGNRVLTPEMAATARDLLEGRMKAPLDLRPAGIHGTALTAWASARRAAVEVLLPLLGSEDGAVIPSDLSDHIADLLDGSVKAPRLYNARKITERAPGRLYAVPVPNGAGRAPESGRVPF
jgi:hypothetical protein